jgi:hypothetical protein
MMALLKNIRKKTRNLNITIHKKQQQQQQKLQQLQYNDESEIKSKEDELIIKTIVILKHVISLYYWIYATKKIYQLYEKEARIYIAKVVILTFDSISTLVLLATIHFMNIKFEKRHYIYFILLFILTSPLIALQY